MTFLLEWLSFSAFFERWVGAGTSVGALDSVEILYVFGSDSEGAIDEGVLDLVLSLVKRRVLKRIVKSQPGSEHKQ